MKLDGLASPSWAARAKAALDVWDIAGDEIFWSANIEGMEERVYFHEIADSLLEHGEAFIALAADPAARVRRPGCAAIAKVAQIAWDGLEPDAVCDRLKTLLVRARPALWRVATADPHPRIRSRAVDAIGELGPAVEGEVQLLIRIAAEDPAGRVRARAVRALARKSQHLEHDLALIADDRDSDVEDALIDVLKQQRSELILPLLWRRLAADPAAHHRVEPRDGSVTSWPLVDILRRYPLDPARARPLMLALIDRDEPDGDAIEAIVEYVDRSCTEVLSRVALRGDRASTFAISALARLGPDAPLDVFAHWLASDRTLHETWGEDVIDEAGFALAATGRARRSDIDLVVHLLERRDVYRTLRFAFAFEDSRIARAAKRLPSTEEHELAVAALALGGARDLDTVQFATRVLDRRRRDMRTRIHCAIAIALVDPDAVPFIEGWPTRMFDAGDALVLALALRLLGRRLPDPMPPPLKELVTGALRFAEMPVGRDDGPSSFLVGDLLREVAVLLRR